MNRNTWFLGLCLASVLSAAYPADAFGQWSETPQEAGQILTKMINGKVITVAVGQQINPLFGHATYEIDGTWLRYRKGMFGRMSLASTQRYQTTLRYMIDSADNRGSDGREDPCTTTLRRSTIAGASGVSSGLLHEKSQIVLENADSSAAVELPYAPRDARLTPSHINWASASFRRVAAPPGSGTHVSINIQAPGQLQPYTSFVVRNDAIANYVENAIRILQLSCARQGDTGPVLSAIRVRPASPLPD